ncbi:NitT/TauT family transport system ATP-binding protein [Cupriavidus gilardii J11]|uniref:NitT/TauT family transport system ATP-binding protein n=1 Tax=Cupriavidus gilardii J11 TaxID=936133 RepID=A0A562B5V8_9BURK|nr:ABC transporter ATP-binding protein [Cupriavidus gilardii]TWG80418.1 NitT/TauT family transport system ATP-binding protein [Cupriavidus gilardii J11]
MMQATQQVHTSAGAGRIAIRDVTVCFEQRGAWLDAVRDISIDVAPGEFVSIIGPSGCGKSTLLNIVAGFLNPSRGAATLDGASIRGPGADRGVVFQQYSLFPWLTVRENVEFGLRMQGIGLAERQVKARTLLGLAGLLAFENHYPEQLSGGMKQRVGIVRALATGPQVLLMDEPFGALDAQTRVVMQEILTNIWQQLRLSVLFITHDIDEAIFLSDKVYVMTARPGTIKAEIPIPLPRPRTAAMTASAEFLALHRQLKELIREESLAAMGGELRPGALDGSWHLGSGGTRAAL